MHLLTFYFILEVSYVSYLQLSTIQQLEVQFYILMIIFYVFILTMLV